MKLVRIGCEGYKPFKMHQELTLRPLTVLFGKNSSGKTVLLRLVRLLLRCLSSRAERSFPLKVDELSFGASFRNLIHQEFPHGKISFSIALECDRQCFDVEATVQNISSISEKDEQIVSQLKLSSPAVLFEWDGSSRNPARYKDIGEIDFNGLLPESRSGLPFASDKLEKLRRHVRNLEERTSHLGAQRSVISSVYEKGVSRPIGLDGNGAMSLLAENSELLEAAGEWYAENMEGWRLSLDQAGSAYRCILQRGSVTVNLAEAGQGMQQALPVVVQQLVHRCNKQVFFLDLVEEPELHLHPAAHAPLADLFLESVKGGAGQAIIETHSENLLLRIRRRIAEGLVAPELVAIYWVEDLEDGSSRVKPIKVLGDGSVDDWPPGVFSEGYREVRAMGRAARSKKEGQA